MVVDAGEAQLRRVYASCDPRRIRCPSRTAVSPSPTTSVSAARSAPLPHRVVRRSPARGLLSRCPSKTRSLSGTYSSKEACQFRWSGPHVEERRDLEAGVLSGNGVGRRRPQGPGRPARRASSTHPVRARQELPATACGTSEASRMRPQHVHDGRLAVRTGDGGHADLWPDQLQARARPRRLRGPPLVGGPEDGVARADAGAHDHPVHAVEDLGPRPQTPSTPRSQQDVAQQLAVLVVGRARSLRRGRSGLAWRRRPTRPARIRGSSRAHPTAL